MRERLMGIMSSVFAFAGSLFVTLPWLAAQAPATLPHYLIYSATTALQRELIPAPVDLFVIVDGSDALQNGKIAAEGLHLQELRKDLAKLKRNQTQLNFRLFFPNVENGRGPADSLPCYALTSLGHQLGFSKITAYGQYPGAGTATWADHIEKLAGQKVEQPLEDEPAKRGEGVKIYPVRTELSRYLTENADCVVVLVDPLQMGNEKVLDKILEATRKTIGDLKLARTNKVLLVAQRGQGSEVEPLLESLRRFTAQLGFGDSSINLR
jgi:hypothetical protein